LLEHHRWNHALAVLGSVGLHFIVFLVAVSDVTMQPYPYQFAQGSDAWRIDRDADDTMLLVTVLDSTGTAADAATMKTINANDKELQDSPIAAVNAASIPAMSGVAEHPTAHEQTEANEASDDREGRALLFARYTNQIQARISRAWRRPRSSVSEDESGTLPVKPANSNLAPAITTAGDSKSGAIDDEPAALDHVFRCEARIVQDARGDVQEVSLLSCNGTPAWQQSLVMAIQSASPLPAPPDPSVFTYALEMSFDAEEYRVGRDDEDYEQGQGFVSTSVVRDAATASMRPRAEPLLPLPILEGTGIVGLDHLRPGQTDSFDPPAEQHEADLSQ
jgi:hypothetical protein